ncbi:YybH family protein [Streptomyces sp. NPDC096105]|uniref:YybH family protein n=1 Tax=Streptomyces sp. NPDC096105 TaxID=3366074 RepID=UPI00382AAAF5
MSKVKHTLPIAAAAIVLTAGSIAGPRIIQTEPVAAASTTAGSPSAAEAPSGAGTSANAAARTKAGARAVATSPEQLLQLLGERIVAKDIDGIIALHEPEAAIVDWDGSVIRGRAAIRAFYIDWFESNPVLTVNPRQTVVAGGWRGLDNKVRQRTAAIMGDYSLEQDAADGTRESFTGNFCDTVQEQLDGTWLYVQDNPYPPHGDPAAPATSHH